MMGWPKGDAGTPKQLEPQAEAVHLAKLTEKEQDCMAGLDLCQRAEVAWLDKEGIPYDELVSRL